MRDIFYLNIILEAITSNNQDIAALIPAEYYCFKSSTTATVLAAIVSPFMAGLDNTNRFNLAKRK